MQQIMLVVEEYGRPLAAGDIGTSLLKEIADVPRHHHAVHQKSLERAKGGKQSSPTVAFGSKAALTAPQRGFRSSSCNRHEPTEGTCRLRANIGIGRALRWLLNCKFR